MAEKKGLPWGKIALAVAAVYLIGRCSQGGQDPPAAAVEAQAPAYAVHVVSVTCDPNHGRPKAEIVIRNDGPEIANAAVFATFGSESKRGYFRPDPIPTGSMAEATLYASDGASPACGIAQIQDGQGRQIAFSK